VLVQLVYMYTLPGMYELPKESSNSHAMCTATVAGIWQNRTSYVHPVQEAVEGDKYLVPSGEQGKLVMRCLTEFGLYLLPTTQIKGEGL